MTVSTIDLLRQTPRFKNEKDAMAFMEALRKHEPIPEGVMILPYEVVDGRAVVRHDYVHAPFEVAYLIQERIEDEIVNV